MEHQEALRELTRFLDSVAKNYRSGIPLSSEREHPERKIVFVAQHPLAPVEQQLLHDAVTKGLQLFEDSFEVCLRSDASWKKRASKAGAVVFLGGQREEIRGVPSVSTHEAKDVLARKEAKREFWEHLKSISEHLKR